jgi:hypothetical protein
MERTTQTGERRRLAEFSRPQDREHPQREVGTSELVRKFFSGSLRDTPSSSLGRAPEYSKGLIAEEKL